MKNKKVVVKIGSSVLAPGACMDHGLLRGIVEQLCSLLDAGVRICLVSSGAIVSGIQVMGMKRGTKDINKKQALAAIGQIRLMDEYTKELARLGRVAGQILLTRDDIEDRKRYVNARHTIEALFDMKALPIVNENDTISIDEIKFGDNDNLSARVAALLGADMLLILSNVEGFLIDGAVVPEVHDIGPDILRHIKRPASAFTHGGMDSKLEAIAIAMRAGMRVVLAGGRTPDVITRAVRGESVGTLFHPGRKMPARKQWIHARRARGTIVVDPGAAAALRDNGGSLLCRGIRSIKGEFDKNDTVGVVDESGTVIGWGLAEYDAEYLRTRCGGRLPTEVIHRDNFVLKV